MRGYPKISVHLSTHVVCRSSSDPVNAREYQWERGCLDCFPKRRAHWKSGCHMAFWKLNLHLSLDNAEIEPSLILRLKLRNLNFRETSQKEIRDAIAFCSPIPGTVQPQIYPSLWVSVRECECVGGKSLGVGFQNDDLIFTSVHKIRVLLPHRYWLAKHCDISLEFHLIDLQSPSSYAHRVMWRSWCATCRNLLAHRSSVDIATWRLINRGLTPWKKV